MRAHIRQSLYDAGALDDVRAAKAELSTLRTESNWRTAAAVKLAQLATLEARFALDTLAGLERAAERKQVQQVKRSDIVVTIDVEIGRWRCHRGEQSHLTCDLWSEYLTNYKMKIVYTPHTISADVQPVARILPR